MGGMFSCDDKWSGRSFPLRSHSLAVVIPVPTEVEEWSLAGETSFFDLEGIPVES